MRAATGVYERADDAMPTKSLIGHRQSRPCRTGMASLQQQFPCNSVPVRAAVMYNGSIIIASKCAASLFYGRHRGFLRMERA